MNSDYADYYLVTVLFYSTRPLFLDSAEENHDSSDKEEGGEIQLEMVELALGTLDLREFEIHPSRHRRRRRRKKEEPKMQTEGRYGAVCCHTVGYSYIIEIQGMLVYHKKALQGL